MKSIKIVMVVGLILAFILPAQLSAKVVKVKVSVHPNDWNGKCPKRFEFKGVIASDKPGKVKYRWIRSDGANTPVKTLVFRRPGRLTVSDYWQLSAEGKHWEAIKILGPNQMESNKAWFKLKCMRKIAAVRPIKPATAVRPNRPIVASAAVHLKCPDPAAVQLNFSIVRRHSQFRGRIRVTGVIKNLGKKAFQSNPNQAKAYLYELPSGLPPNTTQQGRVVASRAISNLAPGASFNLVYEREWNSSSPSEGEFPNSYRLLIMYDPDIRMDANKDNDDCNLNNNRKERSGTEINDMLK